MTHDHFNQRLDAQHEAFPEGQYGYVLFPCMRSIYIYMYIYIATGCSQYLHHTVIVQKMCGPNKYVDHRRIGHSHYHLCCPAITSHRTVFCEKCLDSSFNTGDCWSFDLFNLFFIGSWNQLVISSVKKWQLAKKRALTSVTKLARGRAGISHNVFVYTENNNILFMSHFHFFPPLIIFYFIIPGHGITRILWTSSRNTSRTPVRLYERTDPFPSAFTLASSCFVCTDKARLTAVMSHVHRRLNTFPLHDTRIEFLTEMSRLWKFA